MANVKHTTNNGETLTTNCKRAATALKRFAEFLGNYDNVYNDMLSKINNDNNTTTFTDDSYNTITMTLTVNDSNDNYTLTIKHTHNAPKTIWSICTQDGTIKDFGDKKELFKYAYDNNLYGNFDDIWIEEKELKDERFDYYETVDYEELDLYKTRTMLELDICDMKIDNTDTKDTKSDTNTNKTPAELKAEINNKYGVNAVYYDTDSILCDAEKQNVCVHQNKATDNEVYVTTTKIIVRDVCDNDEVCTITPYENGKELTTPIPKMKCLTCVIDYVTRLYDMNVVTRETYFKISRVGKRNVVLTYTNTHNIVQCYNISDKMQSLATTAIEKYGYYSKYTRKPLKSRQYDVLELYKKGIYLTISQCNDDENVIKDWYCDIIYKSAHHIGQYTYKELLHLINIIRFNTQEYCDKYFD